MRFRAALLAVVLSAPGVLLLAGTSRADTSLGNWNGSISATAVHLQAGSSAFPNFASGAIDNRYPLAAARLDSSPFANAVASPLDTGPLGQTAAASGQQQQPQYADVRCPPQCDDRPVTFGSAPGPFGSARAADTKAVAAGRGAGGPLGEGGAPAPGAPQADAEALRAAMAAWRARFLTLDDALRYPMLAADTPDSVSGDTARSEARLDGSTLVLDGTSSVGELVLGGGNVVLRDVTVKVTITNDGTPKKTVAVTVGSALVGGTPVVIGADGVSVDGQALPGIGAAGPQASEALNQALASAGVSIRSLGPTEELADHQLTLDAVGVTIRFAPASPAPGVPANFTALSVGEVNAFSLAVPGDAAGELDDGLGDLAGGTAPLPPAPTEAAAPAPAPDDAAAYGEAGEPVSDTFGGSGSAGGAFSGPSYSGAAPAGTSAAPAAAPAPRGDTDRLAAPAVSRRVLGRDKPTELLLLYLLWQSLVIGTVASLYLWRKAQA